MIRTCFHIVLEVCRIFILIDKNQLDVVPTRGLIARIDDNKFGIFFAIARSKMKNARFTDFETLISGIPSLSTEKKECYNDPGWIYFYMVVFRNRTRVTKDA